MQGFKGEDDGPDGLAEEREARPGRVLDERAVRERHEREGARVEGDAEACL